MIFGSASGGGGAATSIVSGGAAKTSAFTPSTGMVYLVDTTSGAFNVQLPTPSSGLFFYLKDKAGQLSTNNITIVRAGSEKIDNVAASRVWAADFGSLLIWSNGTDWFIL